MTLDPGPAYVEPTTAEAQADANAQTNNIVDEILKDWTEFISEMALDELRDRAPEALLNGSFTEAVYAGGKYVGFKPITRAEVAPYLVECLREFVMTLDERVDEQ